MIELEIEKLKEYEKGFQETILDKIRLESFIVSTFKISSLFISWKVLIKIEIYL